EEELAAGVEPGLLAGEVGGNLPVSGVALDRAEHPAEVADVVDKLALIPVQEDVLAAAAGQRLQHVREADVLARGRVRVVQQDEVPGRHAVADEPAFLKELVRGDTECRVVRELDPEVTGEGAGDGELV